MKPVLLLVPGTLTDDEVWADVAAPLAALAQVRIADPRQDDTVPAMAARAWSMLDDLAHDHPVVLAGFSLGGYVAIEMLASPRRTLRAAALVSTSARTDSPEGLAQREKSIRAFERDFGKTIEGIVQWGTHQASEALADRLRRMMLRVGPETAIRQTRAIATRGDHRAALAALALPVMVACGEQDRITPMAWSEELAALIPGARLHRIAECGHMLPMEQAQALVPLLRTLLTAPPLPRPPIPHANTITEGDKP